VTIPTPDTRNTGLFAPVDRIGARTAGLCVYAFDLAVLAGLAAWHGWRMRPVEREITLRQILFTGVQALPFTGLLALLTAFVVVVQAQLQASGFGDPALFGQVMVVIVVREFGPLMVALVVVARSGAAIATELAAMVASHETEALEWSGIRLVDYLVLPRLLGMCVALACLTLLFIAAALAAGFVLSVVLVPGAPSLARFTAALAGNLAPGDGLILLAKTAVPGLFAAGIACREGLSCRPVPTEVPRAATRAVVRAIAAVFIWDTAITALSYAVR
jgi:phospholipid/cholesterol/gamma-HCH transport system permease protein